MDEILMAIMLFVGFAIAALSILFMLMVCAIPFFVYGIWNRVAEIERTIKKYIKEQV